MLGWYFRPSFLNWYHLTFNARLCTGALFYVRYSFLLISNEFCDVKFTALGGRGGPCSKEDLLHCAPAERAHTLTLFRLYSYVLCGREGQAQPLEGVGPETHVHKTYNIQYRIQKLMYIKLPMDL